MLGFMPYNSIFVMELNSCNKSIVQLRVDHFVFSIVLGNQSVSAPHSSSPDTVALNSAVVLCYCLFKCYDSDN